MAGQNGLNVSFEQLIQQLMSTENQNRSRAEELFNHAKQQPAALVPKLTASEARALCAVLLRKVRTCF